MLVKEQYIKRHDTVCAQKEIRVKLDNEHWYKHALKLVEISPEGKVTLLWNQQV